MFRCRKCQEIFKGNVSVCPKCGEPGEVWEPIRQQAKVPSVPVMMQRILNYKIHYDND